MSDNTKIMYDIGIYIAEIYDQTETQTDDVQLIKKLIQGMGKLRIFEPFCGDGRIFLPLLQDGHEVVGLDRARSMLDDAGKKIADLPEDAQNRVALMEADATAGGWPEGFDLVILGANCFYELATSEEQEGCIASAAKSLKPGGYLYLDNNHMEGELDESWCNIDQGPRPAYPTGVCKDGTRVEGFWETIWVDRPKRLWRCRRGVTVTFPDGTVKTQEGIQQKHPVSVVEQKEWLSKHGFEIIHLFGDRFETPYTDECGRGIFWARKAG